MKRSEMLDEMTAIIYSHSATYPQYPLTNLLTLAEEILTYQEKIGMMPPFNKPFMDSSNGESSINLKNYTWEKEE